MKIAVSGKGGSGKTVFAASLGLLFAENKKTYLIDADPDGNLGLTAGFSDDELKKIIPVSELKELIAERTQSNGGGFYKLNPEVSDIPEKYSLKNGNLGLLVLGSLKKAGSGCYCSENTFLRSLLAHLILKSDEVILIDMPAGIEHLTRGTAEAIDKIYIIVEPTIKSIQTSERIIQLTKELNIPEVIIVANKITGIQDKKFIQQNLKSNIEMYLDFDTRLSEFEQRKLSLKKTQYFAQMDKEILRGQNCLK